ncbi:hypothetical protein LJY25_05390 [Hymenobacter sp. BT175]|uniref:OmpP1/FadL family transporter n=1 Tax=Hymenobacter translucens TaxID=2886507 RepID=UPI001D0F2A51|nr:hypothetical protein [Hymenobacter translucens]MCC2545869.1 hypothetical protein [Hymenobacter translucens]
MKNLKLWLGLALLSWSGHAFAQDEVDALRYSRLQFGGPARTLGIGGANVALGSDLGNLTSNPAGLGMFRKSEISFTPGFGQINTEASGTGQRTTNTRNNFHVGNFGLAFTSRLADDDNSSDWRGGTLALGLTRLNNFNSQFRYNGTVTDDASFFQYLREAPTTSYTGINNQYLKDQYTTLNGVAYGAYLTYLDTTGTGSSRRVQLKTLSRSGAIRQDETVLTKGSHNQFDIGYGASYQDRLYIGGALGIVSSRYSSVSTFREAEDVNSTVFSNFTLRDQLDTDGGGFNVRLGAIYRANDWVRLGASVQTPTFMRLTDSYSRQITTEFGQPVVIEGKSTTSIAASTQPGEYTYALTTPFRASAGAAVLAGKIGFLTADAEYVNYSNARLNSDASTGDTYDFEVENQNISSLYQSAVNLRFGAEARYNIFRVRGGYARYGDPYKNNDFDRTQQFFTGGVGIRQDNFFLDLAGVYTTLNRYYTPYTIADKTLQPVITVKGNQFTTSVTAGVTF